MLKGFDEETAPLNKEELELVPLFVNLFRRHIGKDKQITSKEIIRQLELYKNITATGPRVRKIINHLRRCNIVPRLLGNSKGYWVSTDRNELKDFIESLEGRARAIHAVAIAMKEQYQ